METRFAKLLETQFKVQENEGDAERSIGWLIRFDSTNRRLFSNTHLDKTVQIQELENKFNLVVGNRPSTNPPKYNTTLADDLTTVQGNLACQDGDYRGGIGRFAGEAYRDQRLLGLMQD
eukprot:6490914-Amphidinium_carterae.1